MSRQQTHYKHVQLISYQEELSFNNSIIYLDHLTRNTKINVSHKYQMLT